jgi:hypothetical protein
VPTKRDVSRSSRTLGAGCDGRETAHKTNALFLRTTKPRGLDASTLALSWRQCSRIAPVTVTKKPDRRRERGISRKAIAQGMPDRFGGPVVTNSCAFYLAHEAAGEPDARHSLLPLLLRDGNRLKARAKFAARTRNHTLMDGDFCTFGVGPPIVAKGARRRNIASFPCHFGPLGLERRHARSPRTPGGLLWA